MKRKSLATLLSGFLTVCLTGVGFAAWLILEGTSTTVQGNIEVETVTKKQIGLTATPATGANIYFGKPSTGANSGWLRNDEVTKVEVLSFDLTLTVENATIINDNGIVFSFEDGADKFDAAETADYVTGPEYYLVTKTGDNETETKIDNGAFKTFTNTDNSTVYTIRIKFGWGSHFDNKNPYEYYNSKKSSDKVDSTKDDSKTWSEDAFDALDAMEALNNETFTFTISADI